MGDRSLTVDLVCSPNDIKMETVASVMVPIRERAFTTSRDLRDSYSQIPSFSPLGSSSASFGKGWSTSPKFVLRTIDRPPSLYWGSLSSAWAHFTGIRLRQFLDDWLILVHLSKILLAWDLFGGFIKIIGS